LNIFELSDVRRSESEIRIPKLSLSVKSFKLGADNLTSSMKKPLIVASFLLFLSCQSSKIIQSESSAEIIQRKANEISFEDKIEVLRNKYHIPSLSVGIVTQKQLAWYKGYGFADIQKQIVPTENTVYHLASVTKTFGSIILMQLVEQGKVSLDDPISKYGINLGGRWGSDERIKVKHLLTHTAAGSSSNGYKPGYSFKYNGDWYGRLGKVIEKASGRSFGELVMENIIRPLGMSNTVPSLNDTVDFNLTGYEMDAFRTKVAKPYNWAGKKINDVDFKYGFGPAAGLMSTVADLVKYSNAIDEKKFLKPETWNQVFTPFVTPNGKTIQYGLGWYVKTYNGVKMMWHTGWWFGYSALFLKVPEKDLTFIVLANSQDLTRPFYLTLYPVPLPNPFNRSLNSDLLVSDFAREFVETFVAKR